MLLLLPFRCLNRNIDNTNVRQPSRRCFLSKVHFRRPDAIFSPKESRCRCSLVVCQQINILLTQLKHPPLSPPHLPQSSAPFANISPPFQLHFTMLHFSNINLLHIFCCRLWYQEVTETGSYIWVDIQAGYEYLLNYQENYKFGRQSGSRIVESWSLKFSFKVCVVGRAAIRNTNLAVVLFVSQI